MSAARDVYSAFALTIASEISLPELPPAGAAPDVEVHIGEIPDIPRSGAAFSIRVQSSDVRGWIPGVGAFSVSGGNRIVVAPLDGADERALRLTIVGPLLGVILSQRGKFVLHASTAVVDGRAVAFTGLSGAGKSTLAAALMRVGHPLIADDMTVIDISDEIPFVQPGFPRIKLWPDSAEALAYDAASLNLVHPDRTKRSLPTATTFHAQAVPLVRCYLLEDDSGHSICELSATAAILSLVKCTYQSHWLHETGASGANLLHSGSLVRTGVVRRLRRLRSFDALAEVIALIEDDVRSSRS